METATLEAPAVNTQPDTDVSGIETESAAKPVSGTAVKPDAPKAGGQSVKAEAAQLQKLLLRQKEDPNVRFTHKELDLLEKYDFGDKPPVESKKESLKPEGTEKEEVATDEETQEVETESEPETQPETDPVLEALMKEVGAKKTDELLAKIKGLKSLTGSRDAQAAAALKKENDSYKATVSSQAKLLGDAKKGDAHALAFLEKNFGLRLAPVSGQSVSNTQNETPSLIDLEKFIDRDSGDMVNRVLSGFKKEVDTLKSELESERARNRNEALSAQAENHVVDEMVKVAQYFDTLKVIPNLRESIAAWNKGKADPRLEVLNDLFNIAEEKPGIDLETAYEIKRGRDAQKLIAEAREGGKKEAYGHKPNPSLSGAQGGKGEPSKYNNMPDEVLEAIAVDYKKHPKDWYDKDGNIVQSKIPKRAWKHFGFSDKAVSVA